MAQTTQLMVVKKSLKDPEELHELQARGALRASMSAIGSCYNGIGFAPASRSEMLMSSTCDPTDPNCISGTLLAIVNKASDFPAREYVAFALLTVLNGRRQEWAGHVLERLQHLEEGLVVAAAHIVGCSPHNALVEVMADDHESVLQGLLALTDIEGVVDVNVLQGRAEHTRGFGTKAAAG